MKTAAQGAANWVGSAGRAATGYQQGVEGYTGDWAGATTSQYNAWVAGLADAQARGAWQAGVQRVGTGGWKQATVNKIPNYSQGFQAGAQRQAAAMQKIIAAEQNIVASLPPRGTYQQNVQRATAFMDNMHALRGQLGA